MCQIDWKVIMCTVDIKHVLDDELPEQVDVVKGGVDDGGHH